MTIKQISIIGGRHSVSGLIATVFGATGFSGRYVVNRLGRIGTQIVIPYRGDETSFRHLRVMGDLGQIIPVEYSIRNQESIELAVSRSNVAINLVGRQWKTKNFSIKEANVDSAYSIAKAAKKSGIERFVHVSSVSASPNARSEFGKAKYEAELAVRDVFPEATILRVATLFGSEDRLLNRYISLKWPFIPVLTDGGKEQPLFVADLANAISKVVTDQKNQFAGKTLDLAGPQVYEHTELIDYVVNTLGVKKWKQPISSAQARLISGVTDYLRNPKFTSDEILYATQDNTTDKNSAQLLGIEVSSLTSAASPIVRTYRQADIIETRG
eukprot:TRINITY_DN4103_c0_g1_i1.p1 TRINITY_DN4103_c0_g1~~TRINITY_DN4103_c0_g1_i1.p1  ORF type:complete len:327 (-),score=68.20 TRINITY_DN4103_c0_g1_i1:145-1125(-)